jgi:hypothetical protein
MQVSSTAQTEAANLQTTWNAKVQGFWKDMEQYKHLTVNTATGAPQAGALMTKSNTPLAAIAMIIVALVLKK